MSSIISPTQLKVLCEEYGFTPSKKYGQNYLISDAPLQKMGEAAGLSSSDTVLEIGPGFGQLTLFLAQHAGKVVSFEIEKKLQPYWEKMLSDYESIQIIWGNFLKEFDNVASQIGEYKVVANLPYQITSHALRTMLESDNPPKSITVMVQKEVAERMCEKPGNMSLLSVSVQYFGKPHVVSKVPKGSFWPMPQVDSAIVHISDIAKKEDSTLFFKVVRAGFSNKRKMLYKNLSDGLHISKDIIKKVLSNVCGSDLVRAQELSISEWETLVVQLSSYGTRTRA